MMSTLSFTGIFVLAVLFFIYFSWTYTSKDGIQNQKSTDWPILFVLAAALLLRIIVSGSIRGHGVDIGCFSAWSNMIFDKGINEFYSYCRANNVFVDYPPGYMYLLYIVGAVKKLLEISADTKPYYILLKMPAVLADIAAAYVLYRFAKDKISNTGAIVVAMLYAFNPFTYLNSAAWGQVDSVFALFALLSFVFLYEDKPEWSAGAFAISLLVKPQALIFFPVYIWFIIDLFVKKNPKALIISLRSVGVGFAAFLIGVLTFSKNFDIWWIVELYQKTLSSYPYASLNAFNLFALVGKNWAGVGEPFIIFSFNVWSTFFLTCGVLASAVIYFMWQGKERIFLSAAFINITMFILAAKMHERYLFPAFVLLLAAYVVGKNKKILSVYGILSVAFYFNVAYVFAKAMQNPPVYHIPRTDGLMLTISFVTVATYIYLCYIIIRGMNAMKVEAMGNELENMQENSEQGRQESGERKKGKKNQSPPPKAPDVSFPIASSAPIIKYTRLDFILLLSLLIVYSAIAYFNLGDTKAPQSYHVFKNSEVIVADLGSSVKVDKMMIFQGQTTPKYRLAYSLDGVNFEQGEEFEKGYVFQWIENPIGKPVRYVKITNVKGGAGVMMNEIAFIAEGKPLPIVSISGKDGTIIPELYDEQNIVPDRISYQNGTYFDEIYHARTAFENLNGIEPTETSHPPLGKLIMAIGVKIFGMTPFGWRFMGTLFGIIMIAAMYLFGRQVFKSEWFAFIAAFLMTFDFMHLTQTRIATIDSYAVVFIILMYYFMYQFYETNFLTDEPRKYLKPLFYSGLFFGIGAASKWICIYAGIGLAVMFFANVIGRMVEYNRAWDNKYKNSKQAQFIRRQFYPIMGRLLGFAALFFIVIPFSVYVLSYFPFVFIKGNSYSLGQVFSYQKFMFNYHNKLTASHPYGSPWYTWPVMYKPMWYYAGQSLPSGVISSISAFGNPAVWWTGLAATFVALFSGVLKKDKIVLFLFVGYMSQYMPWMGISRVIFIYHYFASVPFIIMFVVYVMKLIYDSASTPKSLLGLKIGAGVYLGIVLLLFVMFYPVLSGYEVDKSYVEHTLRWMKSWVFFSG